MSVEYQAANVRPPMSDNTNPSSVALYNVTSSSQATAVPATVLDAQGRVVPWAAKFVTVTALSGNVWFFFSKDSAAVVDDTQAGTTNGNNTKTVGKKLTPGQSIPVRLPYAADNEKIYFVRKNASGDATGTAELWLSSD